MSAKRRKGLLAAALVFAIGGCAIVPADRVYDNGYGAAVTVSPAVVVTPFVVWPFVRHWRGGHRGHGHRGWRGRH